MPALGGFCMEFPMVTSLTPHEVRVHFAAAVREGYKIVPRCDACGKSQVAAFGVAYRHWRRKRGFPDPGGTSAQFAPP